MAIGSDRLPASFRGVSFLVTSESESGGKKHDTHEYPNADFRFTEELGMLSPTFTLQGIVHGENANSRRSALINALSRRGVGTLVHPARGTVQVQCISYVASSENENNGQHAFSMTFQASRQNATLSPGLLSASSISVRVFSAIGLMQTAFSSAYQTPDGTLNITSAQNKLTSISSDLSTAFSVPNLVQSQASMFRSALRVFNDGITQNSLSGSRTASSLNALFATTENIFTNAGDGLSPWLGLTTFGDDDQEIDRTTFNRTQREENRLILNDYVRIYSFAGALEAASFRDYSTDTEIIEAKQVLTQAFDDVFLTPDSVIGRDEDIKSPISDIYADTLRILDEKIINTPRVVSVNVASSSAALTSYLYYASIDREDTIAGLNPSVNRSAYLEEVRVLSD